VGRAAELKRLRDSWSSRRRLTAIVGESGIGKTRLVAELLMGLPDEPTVLWGRCSEESLGSYLPFIEVLRHVIDHMDTASLRAAVGARGELIRLVPELVDRIGDLPVPTKAEAGTEQRMLFEAVAAFLRHWTPMILVIEDLHWADEATLALLTYLVRDHRLAGLVSFATARPFQRDSRASGLLAELERDVDVARIHLHGLSGTELELLVSDLVGSPAPPVLVESVAAATDGNPFFVEEMTMHLVGSGSTAETSDVGYQSEVQRAGVPERVREMVVRRLLSL
jgi:predicted ATPase